MLEMMMIMLMLRFSHMFHSNAHLSCHIYTHTHTHTHNRTHTLTHGKWSKWMPQCLILSKIWKIWKWRHQHWEDPEMRESERERMIERGMKTVWEIVKNAFAVWEKWPLGLRYGTVLCRCPFLGFSSFTLTHGILVEKLYNKSSEKIVVFTHIEKKQQHTDGIYRIV